MTIKNIKEIKPLFTAVVTTADKEMEENPMIIQLNKNNGNVSLVQKVIAVGDVVDAKGSIKIGDIVHINPINYGKPKYKENSLKDGIIENNFMVEYNIPVIELNKKEYLFIQDRDIDYIIKDFD